MAETDTLTYKAKRLIERSKTGEVRYYETAFNIYPEPPRIYVETVFLIFDRDYGIFMLNDEKILVKFTCFDNLLN
jgi:hypothetical protein